MNKFYDVFKSTMNFMLFYVRSPVYVDR